MSECWNLFELVPGLREWVAALDPAEDAALPPVPCHVWKVKRYGRHVLVRYVKCKAEGGEEVPGVLRSLVVDIVTKQLVCFSPPKAIAWESLVSAHSEPTPSVRIEEWVEGTMINLFWDDALQDFQLCTRSAIGGANSFYREPGKEPKTFRQLFDEAAAANAFSTLCLSRECCYSFVLQHRDNRIVTPMVQPQLILVAVYRMSEEEPFVVNQLPITSDTVHLTLLTNSRVRLPEQYWVESWEELVQKFASNDGSTPYHVCGAMVHAGGTRSKVRNPAYERVRQMRGNHCNLPLQILHVLQREEDNVETFLEMFPEKRETVVAFQARVQRLEEDLFRWYRDYHVRHAVEEGIKGVPAAYRQHLYHLHSQYLQSGKTPIRPPMVAGYVRSLSPEAVWDCLRRVKSNLEETHHN